MNTEVRAVSLSLSERVSGYLLHHEEVTKQGKHHNHRSCVLQPSWDTDSRNCINDPASTLIHHESHGPKTSQLEKDQCVWYLKHLIMPICVYKQERIVFLNTFPIVGTLIFQECAKTTQLIIKQISSEFASGTWTLQA